MCLLVPWHAASLLHAARALRSRISSDGSNDGKQNLCSCCQGLRGRMQDSVLDWPRLLGDHSNTMGIPILSVSIYITIICCNHLQDPGSASTSSFLASGNPNLDPHINSGSVAKLSHQVHFGESK